MSSRRRNRRCRNCPDEQQPQPVQTAVDKVKPKLAGKRLDNNLLTREDESNRLWNHVLFGTATCVGMIEGYVALGLPGSPKPQIDQLIRRLVDITKQLEEQDAH